MLCWRRSSKKVENMLDRKKVLVSRYGQNTSFRGVCENNNLLLQISNLYEGSFLQQQTIAFCSKSKPAKMRLPTFEKVKNFPSRCEYFIHVLSRDLAHLYAIGNATPKPLHDFFSSQGLTHALADHARHRQRYTDSKMAVPWTTTR